MTTKPPVGLTSSVLLGVFAIQAAAQFNPGPLELSLVVVGGNTVQAGSDITIEGYVTNASGAVMGIRAGQWDLPCSDGYLTNTGGTTDTDGNGTHGPEDNSLGLPCIFGSAKTAPFGSGSCSIVNTPFPPGSVHNLQADETRWIGTMFYHVAECAVGDLSVNFECTDQGGPLTTCDSVPEPSNTTRYRDGSPGSGLYVALNPSGVTLHVAAVGTCCDGLSCLSEVASADCCEAAFPGSAFRPTRSCADADPCCKRYGDVYPVPWGSGVVDVDDIFCVAGGFANPADCPTADLFPCSGNGLVDIDDLLAILDAFEGRVVCPGMCPP